MTLIEAKSFFFFFFFSLELVAKYFEEKIKTCQEERHSWVLQGSQAAHPQGDANSPKLKQRRSQCGPRTLMLKMRTQLIEGKWALRRPRCTENTSELPVDLWPGYCTTAADTHQHTVHIIYFFILSSVPSQSWNATENYNNRKMNNTVVGVGAPDTMIFWLHRKSIRTQIYASSQCTID